MDAPVTITDCQSLVPQRPPMLMIGTYTYHDPDHCQSTLAVDGAGLFVEPGGTLASVAVIEHIAQTAAAHLGYQRTLRGLPIVVGVLGDVTHCHLAARAKAGDTLATTLTVVNVVDGITLAAAEVRVADTLICSCRVKLALQDPEA